VSGTASLIYGYHASNATAISVEVAFDEDHPVAEYIAGYQWYCDGELIEGADAAVYRIPEGLDRGDYEFTCVVTVSNSDNGDFKEFTSGAHTLQVGKSSMEVETSSHEAYYDGTDNHSISVKVTKPASSAEYEIYYSTTELNETNYASEGSLDPIKVKDVNVDDGNRTSYTVYYYILDKTETKNYGDASGHQTITIRPVTLTLQSGSEVYYKTYDGAASVQGSVTVKDTDLYRLVREGDIYEIEGIISEEVDAGYIIDCDADFNSRHTMDASAVILSDIKLANTDGTINYNYVFADSYQVQFPGYIETKSVTIEWGLTSFEYNGELQGPEAVFDKTQLADADKDAIVIVVSGKQRYVDTYTAFAKMELAAKEESEPEANRMKPTIQRNTKTAGKVLISANKALPSANRSVESDTQITDYSLANGAQQYEITPKQLTVAMKDASVTYDGDDHILSEGKITDGELFEGYTFTCEPDGDPKKDAGEYTYKPKNVKIFDKDKLDISENYEIQTDSGTLTIGKRTVTVSGFTVNDKYYDGTTDAEFASYDVTFDNIIEGDDLSLDGSKLTAVFDTADAGEDKTVTITIGEGALQGADAKNYILDVAGSTTTTTASIMAKELIFTPDGKSTVYGEEVTFTGSYDGFVEGETIADVTFAGQPVYQIGKSEDAKEAYTTATHAGTYTIYVTAPAVTAGNYSVTTETGTLTVMPRPVAVEAAPRTADNPYVTKVYDGTTKATVGESDYRFAEDENATGPSGVVNGDAIGLTFTAAYADKNVGTPDVNMNNLSIDNDDYTLVTASFTIPGEITKKSLTITAKNKTVTYGVTTNPVYEVTYSGFATGENEHTAGMFAGTLGYDCDYDCTDAAKRNAGTYDIMPKGLTSPNYDITFAKGTLTVNKATLRIQATASPTVLTYGSDPLPALGFTPAGLKYNESFDDVVTTVKPLTYNMGGLTDMAVTDGETTTRVVSSVPGDYTITPVINGVFTSKNYNFTTSAVTVTVSQYNLGISGITVNSKVYDGTTTVKASQIDYSNVYFDGILPIDRQYMQNNGITGESQITVVAEYDNADGTGKDAGTAKKVNVQITLNGDSYLAQRAFINGDRNNQTETTADITPRPIKVEANFTSVPYGGEIPEYTVSFKKTAAADSGLVSGETADASNVTLTCSYTTSSQVTQTEPEYLIITPSNLHDSASTTIKASNYSPMYVIGKLQVYAHQLDAPQTVWDTNNPGTITFNKVNPIGQVEVDSYVLKLQKKVSGTFTDIAGAGTTIVSDGTTSKYTYDGFKETVRSNGAGEYRVVAKAIASEVNNVNKINVQDSDFGTGTSLFATKVTFVYQKGSEKQAGVTDNSQLTVNNMASYVVLAGEKNIPLKAVLKNATGYTIKNVASTNAKVTISQKTDAGRNGDTFTSSFNMGSNLASAANTTIVLTLNARPATLVVSIARTDAGKNEEKNPTYGYTQPPVYTATVNVATSDNTTKSNYTYDYVWWLKEGYSKSSDDSCTTTWTFPTGKPANEGNPSYYTICALVTATRLDNGETTENSKTFKSDPLLPYVKNLEIYMADFYCDATIGSFIDAEETRRGWTYGQTPGEQKIINLVPEDVDEVSHTGLTDITFQYSDDKIHWSKEKPSDAGTYYVQAIIPKSNNFNEYATDADSVYSVFTIDQTQLQVPTNLKVRQSETAPYGTISWDAVFAPKKNGNGTAVPVTYVVKLYENTNPVQNNMYAQNKGVSREGVDPTPIKTYEPITGTSMDITADMQEYATYYYTVQAVSGDQRNCLNSDIATSEMVRIGADITVSGSGTWANNQYTQTYDNTFATIKALYGGTVQAYQWYAGSEAIEGETGATLKVKHVSESGPYSCKLTVNGETIYTPVAMVTINPRKITLTSATDNKIYDGTALTNHGVTVTEDGIADGETITYSFTGTVTNVSQGKVNNSFTYTVKKSDPSDTEAIEMSDYTITKKSGKLHITPRDIAA
ncbi:MAG: hypothetical protein HUJ58_00255, partial [Erysipelotrichaceae bacterium]|nr:hypothetical protein [Erysipelotrichaceae bacterium]